MKCHGAWQDARIVHPNIVPSSPIGPVIPVGSDHEFHAGIPEDAEPS